MARGHRNNYYGVRVGRDGPQVYSTWDECHEAVRIKLSGFPKASFRGFATFDQAEEWLNEWISLGLPSQPSSPQNSSAHLVQESPMANHIQDSLETQADILDEVQSADQLPDVADTRLSSEFQRIEITNDSPIRPTLSSQQLSVLERVKRGENIFFTGSAGTGKSVLLRAIIDVLKGKWQQDLAVAVTASTGIAAVNIGGSTLHSFAGIGLGKGRVEGLIEQVKIRKASRERWEAVKTLIIDEVSMIDGSLFDKLEFIARKVRNSEKPFGGIQLVLSGDFCQLPPVPDLHDGVQIPIIFAFDAKSWSKCIGTPVELNKVFRQKEQLFIRMLNSMRFGEISKEDEERFKALGRPLVYDDGIEPTELFPLRREVERANSTRLANLPDPKHTYMSLDIPGTDIRGYPVTSQQAEKLLERLVAVKELKLKAGAQVMLIKNLVQGSLVNGSLGKVVGFKTVAEARTANEDIGLADNSQESNRNRREDAEVSPRTMEILSGSTRVWPLVQFTNGRRLLCVPVEFDVVNLRGTREAWRDQVPLILAWALSVHKAQGQTIERVKVDLSRTFEKGQAYVALSRATSMETLQVLGFDRSRVMAHPRVLKWISDLREEIDKEEALSITQDTDSEDAIKADFEGYEDEEMSY